jgi:hypothetical protein
MRRLVELLLAALRLPPPSSSVASLVARIIIFYAWRCLAVLLLRPLCLACNSNVHDALTIIILHRSPVLLPRRNSSLSHCPSGHQVQEVKRCGRSKFPCSVCIWRKKMRAVAPSSLLPFSIYFLNQHPCWCCLGRRLLICPDERVTVAANRGGERLQLFGGQGGGEGQQKDELALGVGGALEDGVVLQQTADVLRDGGEARSQGGAEGDESSERKL